MPVRVRFAPSPTGYLHAGNVRTALVNWLFARKEHGIFMLRMDDTDLERSKEEYADAIKEDLTWLGLHWDEYMRQSDRMERYALASEQLKSMGRLYPAYETPEELEIKRKMLAGRGLPPIYDRSALKLTDAEKAAYEAQGRKPHWRFLLDDTPCDWDDLIRGPVSFRATHMSDPVLLREDGMPVYTLASVVDDGELNITHVIRGEDHVSNTAVQVQIYKALGFQVPRFAHMALLKTKEGELSKRIGGNDIRTLREQGILPLAVNALLARIGTSDPVEAVPDMESLVQSFDFTKFGRAPANYDINELATLNEKILRQLPFSEVQEKLPGMTESFWLSIRGNIASFADAANWQRIVQQDIPDTLTPDERAFVREISALLPPEPWDASTYDHWMQAVKPATPRKGKELFLPLRKALTGMEHGPELKLLLPLLGKTKTTERLTAA